MAKKIIKAYKHGDMLDIAVHGKKIDPLRVLAMYADPENWGSINDENGHHWVWQGPFIVGYEFAQDALNEVEE